jgi:hypothetical protein
MKYINFIGDKHPEEVLNTWKNIFYTIPHLIHLDNVTFNQKNPDETIRGYFYLDTLTNNNYVLSQYGIASFSGSKGIIYWSVNDIDEVEKFIESQKLIASNMLSKSPIKYKL